MSLIRLSKRGQDRLNQLNLSPRELEVLNAFLSARGQEHLGEKLFINHQTVKHYMGGIYSKIGFRGVTQLWQYLVRERLVEVVSVDPPPVILPTSLRSLV